ncbi:MAG: hypothetical protein ACQEVA_22490 [Myxococcota bacterium]
MTAEDKHKYLTYGRITAGVIAFVVFVVLAVSATFSGTVADKMFMLGAPLLLSVILLPRDTVPKGDKIELSKDEIAFYESIRRWLIWFRIVIFVVSAGIFLVLPEVV